MDASHQAMEGPAVEIPRTAGPLDITVLMGGPSTERDVSLLSGRAVAEALELVGHRVTRADITPQDVGALDAPSIDAVFIALHGEFGESGQVQELCESRNLPYIGSGQRASELALDKAASKQLFRRARLTTPEWMVIEEFHPPATVAEWLTELPPPVVIKPVNGGSSVDVTIARTAAQRDEALEELLDRYARAMVERFVAGRELTVSILDGQALPVLEIIPANDFYDKDAKYTDCGTRYVFDHGLDAEVVAAVRDAALRAHGALDCRDLSRVDFILDAHNVPQVLEINTIPGFTSHSLLPMAAARVGISFERLVDGIVALAVGRQAYQHDNVLPPRGAGSGRD